MRHIAREQLKTELAQGRDIKLVMAPGSASFHARHIPGSLHFDHPQAAFEALTPDDDIVVYGTERSSPTSAELCRQLVDRGYRHVRRYAGGIDDWTAAGLPVEGHEGS